MATTTHARAKRRPASTSPTATGAPDSRSRGPLAALGRVRILSWLTLAATLLAISQFAYQTLLVPQPGTYQPNWYGAQWIGVPGPTRPVAYFRKTITLQSLPDGAFLTVQGWHSYLLFVNGAQLDNTGTEFASGVFNRAHMYDVTPLLRIGTNSVALRVVNHDDRSPAVRIVLGLTYGDERQIFPSDATWRATADTPLAYPFQGRNGTNWLYTNFDDAAWGAASPADTAGILAGTLTVAPAVYEAPLPTRWITAGPGADAFFYHAVDLPPARVWLRVAADGVTRIFINGHQVVTAQPMTDPPDVFVPSVVTLTAGLYDISPYVHAGRNDVAAHVRSAGVNFGAAAPQDAPAALALDLLVLAPDDAPQHVVADSSWRSSSVATPGWLTGSGTAEWSQATQVDYSAFTPNQPFKLLAPDSEGPDAAMLALLDGAAALLLALAVLGGVAAQLGVRRSAWNAHEAAAAIDRVALAFLPALGLAALLTALGQQPMIPEPFPYTPFWLGVVLATAALAFALTLLNIRLGLSARALAWLGARLRGRGRAPDRTRRLALSGWAALAALAVSAAGAYLATYQLGYDLFWQDELASIDVARGILRGGLPRLLSGFLYPKAELYSYLLAGVMTVFGDGPAAMRAIAVAEYVISLPLTYYVGSRMLNKRAGLLAAIILLFSPIALSWARQARMYQQAELFALVAIYLFYRATQPGARPRAIYLSMLAVVVMYLSHEETFILLPAIAVYFLATQRLTWLRNPHWWIAGASASAIVLFQLYVATSSHPPILGTDLSQRPDIAWAPENFDFNFHVLYKMWAVSLLAVLGTIVSVFTRDRALRYLGLMFWLSLAVLAFWFTLNETRYFYPLLPALALLAAGAAIWLVDQAAGLARQRAAPLMAHAVTGAFAIGVVLATLVVQIGPTTHFALAINRPLGLPYQHPFPDYVRAGQYLRDHWQPGDVVIALAPAVEAEFYGQRVDYVIYQDTALYLIYQNGRIVEDYTGAQVLLNKPDLDAVLARHHRVWLWSAAGYQQPAFAKFGLAQSFALVFEGENTFIYLRSG
jgi:uncharacterized membrane protein